MFFGNRGPVKPNTNVSTMAGQSAAPPPPTVGLTPEQEHERLAALAFGGGRMTKASYTERGARENPGNYVERIDEMFLKASAEKHGVIFCIVKKTILFCLGAQAGHPTDGPGATVTTIYDLSKPAALGSLKGWLAKILDMPVDEVDPEGNGGMAKVVTAPDQPLAGTVVEVNKNMGKTQGKNTGGEKKDFLYVNAIRRVPFVELLGDGTENNPGLPADLRARFYPGDTLQRLVAAEKEQAAQPA